MPMPKARCGLDPFVGRGPQQQGELQTGRSGKVGVLSRGYFALGRDARNVHADQAHSPQTAPGLDKGGWHDVA
jgi:hypothetical protein